MWLAFELTGDVAFQDEAHRWAERMKFRQNDPNSHDIGYLFIPSFVKGYLLTGAPIWRTPALTAAHVLAGRFDDRSGIVQAWGRLDDSQARGSSTIDTMMNLPLLWWAARETGDRSFSEIAGRHAAVSASVYIREDGSTYHTARFDPATGRLISRGTYQGLSESSCWSRGQAWAISGFSEAYRHTREPSLLQAVETASEYYFDKVPDDFVPYWDYTDPEIPAAPRDSAAAAIAVGGFLTMSEVHPDPQKQVEYRKRAFQVLGSLVRGYFNGEPDGNHQGILLHACYSKPHNEGVDSSLITGDFFFVQNLLRASRPATCVSPFSYPKSD
jgi:unsaturated chondroitin disaccharide hydrolase